MQITKLSLSAVFASALLLSVTGANAGAGHNHANEATHSMDSMKVGAVIGSHGRITALYAHLKEIETEFTAGKSDGMHEHAEGIETATKDLDKDATLDVAKKKRVQSYVKNITKLVDKMHNAADAKKMELAKKELVKLKVQVNLLDKQFAHSHKSVAGEKPHNTETKSTEK